MNDIEREKEEVLRAYRHMDKFRGDAEVSTWLYRITVNLCKDYLRSWNYRKQTLQQMLFQKEREPQAPTAEQEVLAKLNQNDLLASIMELPVKYREIIVLYYFEHLKSREITELLELKESTVRVRMSRGLAKLREQMTGGETAWIL